MSRMTQLLEQLLAATPAAPPDADVETLVVGINDGIARRRALLDSVGGPLPIETANDRALLAEVEARRQTWTDAIAQAYVRVGNQLIGLRRARAYSHSQPLPVTRVATAR